MSGMKMSAVSEYAFIFALWQVVQNCVSKKGEKTPLVYLSRFYGMLLVLSCNFFF